MYGSGFRCVGETMDETDFCDSHQKVVAFPPLDEASWKKPLMRVVALILLIIFLIPLIFSLRNLYYGTPAKAQEVW
jgi:hypothetical protein